MSIAREIFREESATDTEIQAIVNELRPIIADLPKNQVIIAMLALVIHNMAVDLKPDELQKIVYQTSEYICMAIEALEEGKSADKTRMN